MPRGIPEVLRWQRLAIAMRPPKVKQLPLCRRRVTPRTIHGVCFVASCDISVDNRDRSMLFRRCIISMLFIANVTTSMTVMTCFACCLVCWFALHFTLARR